MKKNLLPEKSKVYIYPQEKVVKWRPSAREGSVMSHIYSTKKEISLMIYAGLSNIALNELVNLKVNKDNGRIQWKKIKEKDIRKQKDNKFGRYGNTQVTFYLKSQEDSPQSENIIYYYGGGEMYNKLTQMRE